MGIEIQKIGRYAVSSEGLVYTVQADGTLVPKAVRTDKDGYATVKMCFNNHPKQCKVHRLVAESFIPNTENKPVVNHRNGVRNDNRVENLEWATIQENNQHAYSVNGRKAPRSGIINEANPTARPVVQLNKESIPLKFWWSAFQAGNELGCPSTHITRVCKGKRKHTRGFAWRYATEGEIRAERAGI